MGCIAQTVHNHKNVDTYHLVYYSLVGGLNKGSAGD